MKRVLPIIVISQFFCTSLWFAGNAIMGDMLRLLQLDSSYIAWLTSAVQAGFITGTLIFALLAVADRFSPVRVFFICAVAAAAVNSCISLIPLSLPLLLTLRFLTGFFLAGIYPVGMKIAADHYQQGLGTSLGFLVGALVLGTAFPHFLRNALASLPWVYVIYATSTLSAVGGLAMVTFVPDGPHRKPAQKLKASAFLSGFKNSSFRAAAFGYFGHMWEVYAFWAFIPVILSAYAGKHPSAGINISLLAFVIIASGGLASVIGGYLARRFGEKQVATIALSISCLCCLLSPLLLAAGSVWLFTGFLLVWGMAVVPDSPLFSTLIARHAPAETKGSSLTIVNCIGFAITIVSIQLVNALRTADNQQYIYLILAIGPLLGLWALKRNSNHNIG